MSTKAVVTQRKVLEPIIGSRQGVYNVLQNLKTEHGAITPLEYPHEISRGVWRTVVAVPNTTPRKIEGRNGVKVKIRIRPRTVGLTILGLTTLGLVALAAWTVATVVIWVVAHWTLILGSLVVLAILSGLVGGRACVHADHH